MKGRGDFRCAFFLVTLLVKKRQSQSRTMTRFDIVR